MISRAVFRLAVAAAAALVWLGAGATRAAANTLFPDQNSTPLGNASCSEIGGSPGFTVTTLVAIVFESPVAQSNSSFNLTIYSSSACDVNHELYQTGQPGAGAVIALGIPLSASTHLWYTMSNLSGASDGFRIIYN